MRQLRYALCWCFWYWGEPQCADVRPHEVTQLAYFGLYGCSYHVLQFMYYRIIVRQYDVSGVRWRVESQPQGVNQELRERHGRAHAYIPLGLLVHVTRDSQRDRDRLLCVRLIHEWSTELLHGLTPRGAAVYYRNREYYAS